MGDLQPTLLFSIPGIKAHHIQDGQESSLNHSGPQTLSLFMVPTHAPSHSHSGDSKRPVSSAELDFCLHLELPPELELPLPATTQIYHQPPNNYLVPRWDINPDGGCFTRIEFPPLGHGVRQEDIDTFETILAQCTAFHERASPPTSNLTKYNPGDYKPGQNYVSGTGRPNHGQIVLIDEENGSVVGELADDNAVIVEDPKLKPGEKAPVEITVSTDGKRIEVKPLSEDYLSLSRLPAYQNSSIVQNAALASRLIVTTSSYVANIIASGANNFQTKTKPQKPLTFSQTTHGHVRKINSFTAGAANISAKTAGQASKIAQNFGASLANRGERKSKIEKGRQEGYKPGILNKSMIAFSTIADGIATSGKTIFYTGTSSATAMVGHRYGEDARQLANELSQGVTNVGLVYIDVTGVSRRAVIKSVAKGMVVGKVRNGGTVIVGDGDGGVLPPVAPEPSADYASRPPSYYPSDYKGPIEPGKYN